MSKITPVKKQTIIVLTAYLLLTILMTWPTALHLADAIPGDGFDGWQNYWNLWWVKQALLVDGANPFFTTYLYAPAGVSLLFHTLNIFNGLWTLPIQLNLGLTVAYNSVVFVSFVLAGYGGYLLALYTLTRFYPTGQNLRPAAFVAGLIFTMSPFHMAHLLGHMQVFSMIWPPFYVLYLLRTLEPWSTPGDAFPQQQRAAWRNAALACLFLVLASLVAWYHTLYLLIFTAFVLIWTLWQRGSALPNPSFLRRNPEHALRNTQYTANPTGNLDLSLLIRPILLTAAIGLGFAVALSPLLGPMIRDASARPDLETGLLQNISLSADLLAYVLPSEMHPLWGDWAKAIADNFSTTTSERLIFAGFTPLILAFFILIRGWSSRIVKFWAVMMAIFFVLSLGPYLHINGQIVTVGGRQLPLPYLLLYHTVPFIDLTRSLSRYNLMFMLGLGVLVSMALVTLTSQTRNSKLKTVLPLVTIALICFEFLPVPYPVSKIDIPRFYVDISAHTEDYVIAELPMNWDRPTPLLHQTTHGKPLLTAYTSRDNPLELAWRMPVFQQWRYLGPDIIDLPLDRVAPTLFFDFNLRYIVLDYWQMPPGPEREQTERWVAAALPGIQPIYDDGRLEVYQTPPKQQTAPYLSLGQGWGDRQVNREGEAARALGAGSSRQAELFIHHAAQESLSLRLTVTVDSAASVEPQLRIFAEDDLIATLALPAGLSTRTIPLPPFEDDLVKLRLEVDGSDSVLVNGIGFE